MLDATGTTAPMRSGADAPLRLLWIMRSPVFVRNHSAVLRELASRDLVHVAFEHDKEGVAGQRREIDALVAELPNLTAGDAPLPRGLTAAIRRRARTSIDWLRYLGPAYEGASALRERAAALALPPLPALAPLLARRPAARLRLARALRAASALGRRSDRPLIAFLREQEPDLVIVTPLMHFGSPQPDYLRRARELGIPTALVTFSWDNFTNKSLMHEVPDLVTVWNDIQAREAAEHHDAAPERLAVTGAPAYDHWFGWRPRRRRSEHCEAAGLDPAQPYLLYVCSSAFVAPDEPTWVEEWLAAIRAHEPALRGVGVLVRPHPLNARGWDGVALPGAEVWPRGGRDPTDDAARADYFDSIHYAAAVVGINTSAIVEAAILGKRTFTVRTPRYRATQEGTLHFHHLRAERGGPLTVARTLDEHAAQLAAAVASNDGDAADLRGFVERFVRPLGLDVAAAPRTAAALRGVAAGAGRR